jgi:hypothetical protein
MILKRILIFLLCLTFSAKIFGQELKTVQDIGLWLKVGLNYELSKKWDLTVEQQIRFFDNMGMTGAVLSDVGAQYSMNKRFKLAACLRYAYDRKKDLTLTHDMRYNLDLTYQTKSFFNMKLAYRLRYQNRYINLFTFVDEQTKKMHLRHQLEWQYTLKKYKIYANAELFRAYEYYKQPAFETLRITLGNEFDIAAGELDLGVGYERELNAANPLNFYFFKMNYTFKLKHD